MQDALIAADEQSRIIFWSESAERVFGRSAADTLGSSLTSLMPERFRTPHETGVARVIAGGERHVLGGPPVELVGLRADGREFPIELTLGAWNEEGRMFFSGVVRDVSERHRAQRVLATQYEVAAALAGSQELEDGIVHALEAIGVGMGWQAGHLWVLDEAASVLRCRSSWHGEAGSLEPFRAISEGMTFERGIGLPGRVWQAGQPAWIGGLSTEENFPRGNAAGQAGLNAAVAVPLLADGRLHGVVEFFAAETGLEEAPPLQALEGLGQQLGQFLLRREAEAEVAQAERQKRQAAELNDEVVQGLALAHYHLAQGDSDAGARAVSATLEAAKHIVSELLVGVEVTPGRLRRSSAARLPFEG